MKVVLVSVVVIVFVVAVIEDVAVAVVLLVVMGLIAGDENEVTAKERPELPPSKAACSLLVMESCGLRIDAGNHPWMDPTPELSSRPRQKVDLTPTPNYQNQTLSSKP